MPSAHTPPLPQARPDLEADMEEEEAAAAAAAPPGAGMDAEERALVEAAAGVSLGVSDYGAAGL